MRVAIRSLLGFFFKAFGVALAIFGWLLIIVICLILELTK